MDDFTLELKPAVSKMMETCITFEPQFWDVQDNSILEAEGPIFLLGKEFRKELGIEVIKDYVRSRLWFTYRKNFAPIGPDSDQGWGCMLRCAQMVLGETLLRRHLGKHYEWKRVAPTGDYERILRMFLDEKTALYSIHQIGNVLFYNHLEVYHKFFVPFLKIYKLAFVMKKLAVFDSWSDIAVHVALDNILISSDVRTIATLVPPKDAVKLIMEDGNVDESYLTVINESTEYSDVNKPAEWRPLLLLIPLRLGLTNINRCYLPAVQEFFKLDSCVGIIGGRPNHALYFVGIAGDRLIYLDPHFCRPSINEISLGKGKTTCDEFDSIEKTLKTRCSLSSFDTDTSSTLDDTSFHSSMFLHINYDQVNIEVFYSFIPSFVDPSLALAFFCETALAFDTLTKDLKEVIFQNWFLSKVFPSSKPPIFEQLEERPKYWPPFEPYTGVKAKIEMKEFDDMCAPNYDIDDGFEILEEADSSISIQENLEQIEDEFSTI
uniref:Cysteine protease n=1 Tax=Heterorhabditis bacteriophora TaxID=37862 RepID=A0A1I7WTK4_HETBA